MAQQTNDSGLTFPYRSDNWRVWWDEASRLWKAQQWSGKGSTISSDTFEANDVPFVSSGRFLRFENCECKGGLVAFDGPQDVRVTSLRLMPRTQVVAVPTIGSKASSKVFGM